MELKSYNVKELILLVDKTDSLKDSLKDVIKEILTEEKRLRELRKKSKRLSEKSLLKSVLIKQYEKSRRGEWRSNFEIKNNLKMWTWVIDSDWWHCY